MDQAWDSVHMVYTMLQQRVTTVYMKREDKEEDKKKGR